MDFWISGFQFGFLPTVYEISFVTDPSRFTLVSNSANFWSRSVISSGSDSEFGCVTSALHRQRCAGGGKKRRLVANENLP